MTREQKRILLINMFEALRTWPQDLELTALMQHCLSIVNILSEHDRHTRLVALSLRLITKKHKKTSLSSIMRQSFADLEHTSPELRGFKSLFDLTIQENNLRVDTQDLIESLPEKNQTLAQVFLELIHIFDCYDELNTLCDAQKPQVLAVLFLQYLKKILEILALPKESIKFWLENLNINNNIITIFNANISCDNPGDLSNKENLILFLCLYSSQYVHIQKEHLKILQVGLEQAKLPALACFVEWGFMSIET